MGGRHRLGIQRSGATPQHRFIGIVSCNWVFPFQGWIDGTIDMRVPPAWPLACARQVNFLFWPFNLTLKREYVLEVQEKDLRTGGTILRVDTSRKLVEFLPRAYPNEMVHSGTPSSEVSPVPGGLDRNCRVLARRGESLTLHVRIQSLVPCPSSLHQLAKRCHT